MAKRYGMMVLAAWISTAGAGEPESYLDAVNDKLVRGATNVAYGWMEVPKNITNEVNENGMLYAPIGLTKGWVYGFGRFFTGFADLATVLIPTGPMMQPPRVWDKTDTETTFLGQETQP
ncbi:MAG: exosortase system-associated protein, TIGR04073 family [Methylococcaceae bacterium]|nr:MAG: exosortase system-associated protein, TIGR04073 family [Methylococcaceae bacterium]